MLPVTDFGRLEKRMQAKETARTSGCDAESLRSKSMKRNRSLEVLAIVFGMGALVGAVSLAEEPRAASTPQAQVKIINNQPRLDVDGKIVDAHDRRMPEEIRRPLLPLRDQLWQFRWLGKRNPHGMLQLAGSGPLDFPRGHHSRFQASSSATFSTAIPSVGPPVSLATFFQKATPFSPNVLPYATVPMMTFFALAAAITGPTSDSDP